MPRVHHSFGLLLLLLYSKNCSHLICFSHLKKHKIFLDGANWSWTLLCDYRLYEVFGKWKGGISCSVSVNALPDWNVTSKSWKIFSNYFPQCLIGSYLRALNPAVPLWALSHERASMDGYFFFSPFTEHTFTNLNRRLCVRKSLFSLWNWRQKRNLSCQWRLLWRTEVPAHKSPWIF